MWMFWLIMGTFLAGLLTLAVIARRGKEGYGAPLPPLHRRILALSHGLYYGGLWYAGPQNRQRPKESPADPLDYLSEYGQVLEGLQGGPSRSEGRERDTS